VNGTKNRRMFIDRLLPKGALKSIVSSKRASPRMSAHGRGHTTLHRCERRAEFIRSTDLPDTSVRTRARVSVSEWAFEEGRFVSANAWRAGECSSGFAVVDVSRCAGAEC
jgi:hypothetical protein